MESGCRQPAAGDGKRFRPSKGLGQSFLTHLPTAEWIVNSLDPGPDDTVLEIGPGPGILTGRLAGRVRQVIAVEKDARLTGKLERALASSPGVEVVCGDFFEFDLAGLGPLKVLGNLPYSVSSQILFRLLDSVAEWTVAVLTCQREFAVRVLSAPGTRDYAPVGILLDRVCERERLFNIPAHRFRPRPDVVSTCFRLRRRQRPRYEPEDEELFRRVLRAAFSQRRKKLSNNLAAGFGLDKPGAVALLIEAGIEPGARAEQVEGERFRDLADRLAQRVASSSE
ncbi:ribosomal RNA small subunit methyltransferase A [candidate division WOR-3 bacterium]|nr:ribosomal RNA small subunit methyltransferase A [candidate division WOR-3 bacterium]